MAFLWVNSEAEMQALNENGMSVGDIVSIVNGSVGTYKLYDSTEEFYPAGTLDATGFGNGSKWVPLRIDWDSERIGSYVPNNSSSMIPHDESRDDFFPNLVAMTSDFDEAQVCVGCDCGVADLDEDVPYFLGTYRPVVPGSIGINGDDDIVMLPSYPIEGLPLKQAIKEDGTSAFACDCAVSQSGAAITIKDNGNYITIYERDVDDDFELIFKETATSTCVEVYNISMSDTLVIYNDQTYLRTLYLLDGTWTGVQPILMSTYGFSGEDFYNTCVLSGELIAILCDGNINLFKYTYNSWARVFQYDITDYLSGIDNPPVYSQVQKKLVWSCDSGKVICYATIDEVAMTVTAIDTFTNPDIAENLYHSICSVSLPDGDIYAFFSHTDDTWEVRRNTDAMTIFPYTGVYDTNNFSVIGNRIIVNRGTVYYGDIFIYAYLDPYGLILQQPWTEDEPGAYGQGKHYAINGDQVLISDNNMALIRDKSEPLYVFPTDTPVLVKVEMGMNVDITELTVGETTSGTAFKYFVDFVGDDSWQRWNGSSWESVDIADLDTLGNTQAEISTGIESLDNQNFYTLRRFTLLVGISTNDQFTTPALRWTYMTFFSVSTGTAELDDLSQVLVDFVTSGYVTITNNSSYGKIVRLTKHYLN